MADITIKITEDNSAEVLRELESRKEAILEAWGQQGVSHVKEIITRESRVDTGAMRNSITHQVVDSEDAVYVGTNNEYAIYNEYGTGIYAEGGKGRKTPWRYVDDRGEGHWTVGMKPIHMIKNGIADNIDEFKRIAEKMLKG